MFNQRKFVVFRRICKRGPSGYLPTFEIRGLFLHKFSYGIKYSSCLHQCPLILEFSPNSRMLSFEAGMLTAPRCISFKAKWILPQWQVKQSNLQKCISWKRKRLEIINKIEAKRASSATREPNVNTLRWSV